MNIQNQINAILDQETITQDDRDYLKVLGTLVYDYEQQHEKMPTLKGVALLQALLEDVWKVVSRDCNHIFTPLNPPLSRGETRKSSSLPLTRGGLGRGKKYLIHHKGLLKHPLRRIGITTKRFSYYFRK